VRVTRSISLDARYEQALTAAAKRRRTFRGIIVEEALREYLHLAYPVGIKLPRGPRPKNPCPACGRSRKAEAAP